jgi:hypothetical protein
MLGPFSIARGPAPVPLARSRKVRALIAYLALAPRPVARSKLCELLWDAPNDPRGELRWCLAKVRRAVDEPSRPRLVASDETVRLAFFSCADYTHGYYNAYERMATEDVDFVVCLGDYIYDETYHRVADGTAVRDDHVGSPPPDSYKSTGPNSDGIYLAAHTLADYRKKYSLYRSDRSLQRMHQRFPMVVLWDDHEVQDNYAGGERDGGLAPDKRYSNKRKAAAYKAFFEAMPYTPPAPDRIYRRLQFGRTVDLIVTNPDGSSAVATAAFSFK